MIKSMSIYLLEIPMKEPFTISLGTLTMTRNIVVELETKEGCIGLGEASPSKRILGETIEDVIETLKILYKQAKEIPPDNIERLYEIISKVDGAPSAKAAFEMAYLDILGKEWGKPLCKIIGGYREVVNTDITIGIMEPEEQAKRAKYYVDHGFSKLKLKLGLDPEKDAERVKTVREAIGDNIVIRVDANQGWTLEQALWVINKISEYNVELVEQPVKWDDIASMKKLTKEGIIPIAADETVKTPKDALLVAEKEAADIINIKITKSRGIWGAIKIAAISEAAGIKNMIGCMGESRIGITAKTHLALGMKNIVYYDLDSDLLPVKDVVEQGGATIHKGDRRVPDMPGLGIIKIKKDIMKLIEKIK